MDGVPIDASQMMDGAPIDGALLDDLDGVPIKPMEEDIDGIPCELCRMWLCVRITRLVCFYSVYHFRFSRSVQGGDLQGSAIKVGGGG